MKMNSNETKCNIFLGNGLKAMVGMLLVLIAIMLCSCGESSNGKWYYILDPDEGSRYNITFKSSDTLNYDGVDFSYTKDGDTVEVPFVSKTLTFGDYEGCKVIFEDDGDIPKWACSLKEAEKLCKIIYEDGDDSEEVEDEELEEDGEAANIESEQTVFSKELASGNGGIYIKSGEKYVPLLFASEIGGSADNLVEGFQNLGWMYSPFAEPDYGSEVPVLKKGDQLVYFSDSYTPEEDDSIEARKVKDMGYTIPMCFVSYSEFGDCYYVKNQPCDEISFWNIMTCDEDKENQSDDYYEDEDEDEEEYDYYSRINLDDIVAVNNIQRDELFNNNLKIIERKWDEGNRTDKHLEVGILPCKKGETITIEYTKGTAYKKAECPAEVRAFYAENDKVESLPLKLGKEGYAVVDTTDLEKGLHCINGGIFEIA